MKLLDRYVFQGFGTAVLWCITLFLGMFIVLDLMGHLDEILRNHVNSRLLLTYYGTMTPLVFIQVAPFACLMAALYTMGNLNRHQEIMAMRASGMSPWMIARPLLLTSAILSVIVFGIGERLAPEASMTTEAIKANYLDKKPDPNQPHPLIREIQHLTAYGDGHTLLYADTFDPIDQVLTGIVILQHGKDLRLIRKVTAKKGVWTGENWRFLEGTILHFTPDGLTVGRPVPFPAKVIEAGDRPEVLARSESQADYMNMADLRRYITRLESAGSRTISKLWVDWHAKPAAAVACLILTLIGIPYAIQSTRGSTFLGLSIGLGVGLGYYALNSLLLAIGKGGWLPPPVAAWGAPLGVGLFGLRQLWKRLG